MVKRTGRLKGQGGRHGEVGSPSHAGTPPDAPVSVKLLKQPTPAGIYSIGRNKEDHFTKAIAAIALLFFLSLLYFILYFLKTDT